MSRRVTYITLALTAVVAFLVGAIFAGGLTRSATVTGTAKNTPVKTAARTATNPAASIPLVSFADVVERINPALREAAMNLRAGPVRTFLHITLPLSIPGIIAGTFLTFALAMSAFVAPLVLGGGNVMTMTVLMRQSMFTTLNWPLGAAQSVALVLLVVAMLAVYR